MSYTTRIGLEKIEIGSEVDDWGESEHASLDRLDEFVAGILSFACSGDVTITNSNTTSDQLHYAIYNISSGSGGRVILPLKQSTHIVRNGTSGDVTFTTDNSGTEATLESGEVGIVFCDGVNACYAIGPAGGGIKDYVDDGVADAKTYADGLAFSASSLPTQTGNNGKFITTNGSTASWANIAQSNVTNLTADLTANRALALAFAAIL